VHIIPLTFMSWLPGDSKVTPTVVSKEKLGSWLHAPDPSMMHNNLQGQHHEGTGDWFLEIKEYRRWIAKPGSVLWIKGKRMSQSYSASTTVRRLSCFIAGSGKSVLW
jgi:hypothetical protein